MRIISSLLFAACSAVTLPSQAATFTVTQLGDSGAGSLRQAVLSANAGGSGGHVIQFQAGLTGSITLSSPIRISESLSINGPSAQLLAVDGNNATRLFHVQRVSGAARAVSINGLTLRNGAAATGAGIYVENDNLTLFGVELRGNKAQTRGGAIQGYNATLALESSTVIGNGSVSASFTTYGGGIDFSGGKVTLNNSVIAENTADFGGGVLVGSPRAEAVITRTLFRNNVADHTGGGMYASSMTSFVMSDSTFFQNVTGQPKGGALYYAGSIDANAVEGVIQNSAFSDNQSTHQNTDGAALAFSGGRMTLRNSTIANSKGATASVNTTGIGGAVWVDTTNTVLTIHSTLFNTSTHTMANTPMQDIAHVPNLASANPSVIHASDSLFGSMPGLQVINGVNLRNQFATHALLKSLTTADGGGFIPSHPLPYNSPAIDKGSNPGNLVYDLRGAPCVRAWSDPVYRNDPTRSIPDIGAYEFRGDGIFVGDFEQR